MTNPNNAIGTNAAFGGRTSPNAFNDVLAVFTGRGLVSGWACVPDTGMTIALGGDGEHRDVAIAEDNAGNKTTINNIPATPISLTIAAAPATQSRIDAVVAYVSNPPQGSATITDNYGTVGILDVQGATSSSPIAPDDNDIRTAITADGASGATAYYVVLAYITIANGTTTITGNMISAGENAEIDISRLADASITNAKLADNSVDSANIVNNAITNSKVADGAIKKAKLDLSTIRKTIYTGSFNTGSTTLSETIMNFERIKVYGITNDGDKVSVEFIPVSGDNKVELIASHRSGTDYYVKNGVFTFNGTTMTMDQQGEQKTNTTQGASSPNNMSITEVVGWYI